MILKPKKGPLSILVLIIIAAVVFFYFYVLQQKKHHTDFYQEVVSRHFPGWRLPEKNEPSPSFVEGDFNGDGRSDFSCICIMQQDGSLVEIKGQFILFEANSTGKYRPIILDEDVEPHTTYLEKTGKGDLLATISGNSNTDEEVYTPHDMIGEGLLFGTIEASGVLIYWNGKKYSWFWFSD